MKVEIIYALEKEQNILTCEVEKGATVGQLIKQSGILDTYKEIDLTKNKVGIFSKIAKLDTVLQEKDRVEIYRKLIADPKLMRKQRAIKK